TDQSLQFKSVANDNTLIDALVIDPATGAVNRRSLSPAAFGDAIRSLNGLTNKGITIKADTLNQAFGISVNTVDSSITYNIPKVNGVTKYTGLLTYEDWLRFDAKQQAIAIGAFATASSANGLTLNDGVLTLTPADGTNPGAVSTGAQTFAGAKTFNDPLTAGSSATVGGALSVAGTSTLTGATTVGNTLEVTGAATLNNNLSVAGASTLSGATTVGSTLEVTGAATINNTLHATGATTLDGTLRLTAAPPDAASDQNTVLIRNTTTGAVEKKALNPAAFEGAIQQVNGQTGPVLHLLTGAAGMDVNIDSTTAANHIFINVPDAGIAARGVVTTKAQIFAGYKTFRDTVAVGANAVIGTLASNTNQAPNSTLQLNGSLSLAIRTMNGGGPLTSSDNTVLVSTTSGAATITLPAAAGIIGRVYTIKKIAGGIDNALTITPTGGSIEGGPNYIIYNDFTYVTVQTDGTNWYVIRK
ncbi:MAG TPA: hypothetical protein VGC22_04785, partial [Chitinophaga sp.]